MIGHVRVKGGRSEISAMVALGEGGLMWLRVLVALLVLFAWFGVRRAAGQDAVQIAFLDVGQGDAAVIRSPEGKIAVIDAADGLAVLRQLDRFAADTIDLLIASHGHVDHIRDIRQLLQLVPIRYYLDNGLPHTTAAYTQTMMAVERSKAVYLQPTDRTIRLGTVNLLILSPPGWDDQNNNSVGVVVEYGEFKALFTGDSEVEELNYFLDRGMPDVTVLKAAHHGSRNGVSPRWLSVTNPEVVVISVGAGNSYGHPSAWALRYYTTAAERVMRTDLDGTVVVVGHADGTYEVGTEGTGSTAGRGGQERADEGRGADACTGDPPSCAPLRTSAFRDGADLGLTIDVNADAPGNDHNNRNGEYVTIQNADSLDMVIGGWRLCDERSGCYRFPDDAEIAAGGYVVVYTGSGTNTARAFYWGWGRAVWNNDGDTALLYDRSGTLVASYAY